MPIDQPEPATYSQEQVLASTDIPANRELRTLVQEVFVLSRSDDVERLRKRVHGKRALPVRVQIAAPQLGEQARHELERRVERFVRACGCNEGTIAGLLYVIAIPTLLFGGWLEPASVAAWIGIGAGFIAALLAGKLFGLGVARLQLQRALGRVRRILESKMKID